MNWLGLTKRKSHASQSSARNGAHERRSPQKLESGNVGSLMEGLEPRTVASTVSGGPALESATDSGSSIIIDLNQLAPAMVGAEGDLASDSAVQDLVCRGRTAAKTGQNVLLDLSRVTNADTRLVAGIIAIKTDVAQRGRNIVLQASPTVTAWLQVCRLDGSM